LNTLLNYFPLCQGIGVNTGDPDPSAILHVKEGDNNGVLIPRLSQSQINSLSSPAKYLTLYNTDIRKIQFFNGTSWVSLESIPRGTIIMWNGNISEIPFGWALCDGRYYTLAGVPINNSSYIKTPDLRGRFVVGYDPADTDYDQPGKTGGNDLLTLTQNQLPTHTHIIDSDHSHGLKIDSSAHQHSFTYNELLYRNDGDFVPAPISVPGYYFQPILDSVKVTEVQHDFTISSEKSSAVVGTSGGNDPIDVRPPYYVLAFIMKL
jgi:microcystin-dependent protein